MQTNEVQVDADHYEFLKYVTLNRWSSYWHQINEVLNSGCEKVLWVGIGDGVPIKILRDNGIKVTTLDIDNTLSPDIVGDITNLSFENHAFELCCAFQVLEHLPYEQSLIAINELNRVASKKIIISLPNQKPARKFILTFPYIRQFKFLVEKFFFKPKEYLFNGEHYWEIEAKKFSLNTVISDFGLKITNKKLSKNYRLFENPYHHFFIWE
ncbi:methyltransferase domain-containing protein [Acinetobacter sp. F9]|uniref:methyltransferase domain-containing protein n=1 Tax=Acinetobacter sp. F9 TaxID=2853158 RepID=UPI001C4528BB|nr:methyltransferase domain-containing protein [Acinetobacter sp. F9]